MIGVDHLPGHLIRRLQQISVSRFSARMAEAGLDLTSVQYAAMVAMREHSGCDQGTIARWIAYDRVTIGSVIDRLVQKGFVHRMRSTVDRWARVLTLTEVGEAVIDAARPWVDRVQCDILQSLSEGERTAFVATLIKVTRGLGTDDAVPGA